MLFVNSTASPLMDSVTHGTMPESESSEAHFKRFLLREKGFCLWFGSLSSLQGCLKCLNITANIVRLLWWN